MSAVGSPHEDTGDVDREIRLEKVKRELEELSSESVISGSLRDVSPELEEIFLERVCKRPFAAASSVALQPGQEFAAAAVARSLTAATRIIGQQNSRRYAAFARSHRTRRRPN